MRFTPEFLEELKARLPVSEVVGRRVKLQKSGREWNGLSPFNKEKTALVLRQRPEAGLVRLLVRQERRASSTSSWRPRACSFPKPSSGSRRWPACRCRSTPRRKRRATRSARPCTTSWSLRPNSSRRRSAGRGGAKARGYLADRSLDAATQLKFRLGYAPGERFALKEHLGAQGVTVEDMVETGLLIAGDDIPVPYDRFRDRVMFPITDFRGRIIAFGGRALRPTRRRNISTRRRRRSSTRARTSTTAPRRARRRMTAPR